MGFFQKDLTPGKYLLKSKDAEGRTVHTDISKYSKLAEGATEDQHAQINKVLLDAWTAQNPRAEVDPDDFNAHYRGQPQDRALWSAAKAIGGVAVKPLGQYSDTYMAGKQAAEGLVDTGVENVARDAAIGKILSPELKARIAAGDPKTAGLSPEVKSAVQFPTSDVDTAAAIGAGTAAKTAADWYEGYTSPLGLMTGGLGPKILSKLGAPEGARLLSKVMGRAAPEAGKLDEAAAAVDRPLPAGEAELLRAGGRPAAAGPIEPVALLGNEMRAGSRELGYEANVARPQVGYEPPAARPQVGYEAPPSAPLQLTHDASIKLPGRPIDPRVAEARALREIPRPVISARGAAAPEASLSQPGQLPRPKVSSFDDGGYSAYEDALPGGPINPKASPRGGEPYTIGQHEDAIKRVEALGPASPEYPKLQGWRDTLSQLERSQADEFTRQHPAAAAPRIGPTTLIPDRPYLGPVKGLKKNVPAKGPSVEAVDTSWRSGPRPEAGPRPPKVQAPYLRSSIGREAPPSKGVSSAEALGRTKPAVLGKAPADAAGYADAMQAGELRKTPAREGKGIVSMLSHPVDTVRNIARAIETGIDPTSPLKYFAKRSEKAVADTADYLAAAIKTHPDKVKLRFQKDASHVYSALNPLKNKEEQNLFEDIYSLKHFSAQWKGPHHIDYGAPLGKEGTGFGAHADETLAILRNRYESAGKGDMFRKAEEAARDFAARVNEVGYGTVADRLSPQQFDEWAKANPYYMFAKSQSGSEALNDGLPAFDEVFSRHFQGREGFAGIPRMDVTNLFGEYHFKRLLAQDRRLMVSKVVDDIGITGESSSPEMIKAAMKNPELVAYEFPVSHGKRGVAFIPKEIAHFLRQSDDLTTGIFSGVISEATNLFKIGALQANERFLFGSGMRRDLSDMFLRSRGYLTPIDKAIGEGWNKLMDVAGNKSFKEVAPDLEVVMNPAIWLRAAKASIKENLRGGDDLVKSLGETGSLQLGPASELARGALPSQLRGGGAKGAAKAILGGPARLMKMQDDFWRVGQALRSLPEEFRGIKGYGKVMDLKDLPSDFVMKMEDVLNVRATHIDFAMKGEFIRKMDAISPFLSAMVQAPYQTARFAAAQPLSMALRTAGFMSAATAAYVSLKGRPDRPLDKFPELDKGRYIMADTGLRKGNRPIFSVIAVVPEPLQGLWTAVRKGIDIADAKDPSYRDALKARYASDVMGQGISAFGSLGGPVVSTIEGVFNRSLHKGLAPIERPGDKYLDTELRARPGTQNVYRYAAEKMGGVTSPDILKHVARGFGATIPDKVADLVDPLFRDRVRIPDVDVVTRRKPFSVDGLLADSPGAISKAGLQIGALREGRYDADKEIADNSASLVQQKEKNLLAELKHWHTVALLSASKRQKDEALARRDAAIQKMRDELVPYGGMPDVNTVLNSLTKNIMYEANVPHGRALQHIPKRYRAHYLRTLESETGQ